MASTSRIEPSLDEPSTLDSSHQGSGLANGFLVTSTSVLMGKDMETCQDLHQSSAGPQPGLHLGSAHGLNNTVLNIVTSESGDSLHETSVCPMDLLKDGLTVSAQAVSETAHPTNALLTPTATSLADPSSSIDINLRGCVEQDVGETAEGVAASGEPKTESGEQSVMLEPSTVALLRSDDVTAAISVKVSCVESQDVHVESTLAQKEVRVAFGFTVVLCCPLVVVMAGD
jgi:hypothetical protein